MRVAVIGGKLQGVEASYLARKERWHVTLIDREEEVPARGICDDFIKGDVTGKTPRMRKKLDEVDLIIPAVEDKAALERLNETAAERNIPIAHDAKAFLLSFSKIESNVLFKRLDLPMPRSWPHCTFPVFIKPAFSSGSRGTVKAENIFDLRRAVGQDEHTHRNMILQEYLPGPVYSIEVFGGENRCAAGQVTRVEMDEGYDCMRVVVPSGLSRELEKKFEAYGLAIAEAMHLNGIMDVEAILHNGSLKIIEIDARLPSQTPTAVYHSSGINYLSTLRDIFCLKKEPVLPKVHDGNAVIYEHLLVSNGILDIRGEHIIAKAGPVAIIENFFGSDEAITDYTPRASHWVATIIITERRIEDAWERHRRVMETVARTLKLTCRRTEAPVV
ncbi:MAG: 3-methylornithine--L-lysine ligase PylC [Spirochaetes bacterium]|nr:3-methylornithine--L-lysine ligase PylC [Spirochaetota bacterium]